jgi:CYTH domain-containing protein
LDVVSFDIEIVAPMAAARKHRPSRSCHILNMPLPSPDALPVEIERKWLLSQLPPAASTAAHAMLLQGYLPGEQIVERIRSITTAEQTDWVRTIKLGRGRSRIEVEERVSEEFGTSLMALTSGRRVAKRRYQIDAPPLLWEIDEFTDRVLFLAEVELPTAETPIAFPAWLSPYVVREVTDEVEFTNWRLAR